MLKKSFLVCAFLFWLFPSLYSKEMGPRLPLRTYTFYNYRIGFPADWEPVAKGDLHKYVRFNDSAPQHEFARGWLMRTLGSVCVIDRSQINPKVSLSKYFKIYLSGQKDLMGDIKFRLVEKGDAMINKIPAKWLVSKIISPRGQASHLMYFFISMRSLYVIDFMIVPEFFSYSRKDFERAAASFAVLHE